MKEWLPTRKFKFKDYAKWTGDYIFMRIEEMFLTAAEASCRLMMTKAHN